MPSANDAGALFYDGREPALVCLHLEGESDVSFAEAVRTALSKYATFSGRARRSEYWWFTLFSVLAALVGVALDVAIPISDEFRVFAPIVLLGLFLPQLSVLVRRLHDTGRSGWWYFIGFIPLIGGIWLLVLLLNGGDRVDNRYGPSPKYASSLP